MTSHDHDCIARRIPAAECECAEPWQTDADTFGEYYEPREPGAPHDPDGYDYDAGEPAVDRVPVLSTANLSKREGTLDAGDLPLAALGWEHGFLVYVADGRNVIETLADTDPALWPGLLAVCDWAAARGFQWVRFDCDAPALKTLPRWSW